jgi:Ca-activated chloride channel family protein
MDIQFGQPAALAWLWLIPICLSAIGFAVVARRRAATRFATPNLLDKLLSPRPRRRHVVSAILLTLTLTMIVLALIDVRWGKVWRDVPQKGIEVMFVLDVSRSMLAEDAKPNRLERAKQQIKDTVDEMAGDRVGLVIFAGDAKQSIPITSHYDDFKHALDEVGPHSLRRGGSRLGNAIDVATHGFLNKTNDHKAIVVFTDGEDQESDPLEAARRAREDYGIRIFTVGLGNMDRGAKIPVEAGRSRKFLQHEGQPVWSKLNGEILRQVATETDGAYIPAGTKQVNMADVYHGYVANVQQQEFETATINSYQARFQWFLVPALLFLFVETVMMTRPEVTDNQPQASGTVQIESIDHQHGTKHQQHHKAVA